MTSHGMPCTSCRRSGERTSTCGLTLPGAGAWHACERAAEQSSESGGGREGALHPPKAPATRIRLACSTTSAYTLAQQELDVLG